MNKVMLPFVKGEGAFAGAEMSWLIYTICCTSPAGIGFETLCRIQMRDMIINTPSFWQSKEHREFEGSKFCISEKMMSFATEFA